MAMLTAGLYALHQRQRSAALQEVLRLQRTELNYVRCELRAHASLLGVPLPPSERHLRSI